MSNVGEAFDFSAEQAKLKRAHNQQASTSILKHKQIPFESRNNGSHLIIKFNDETLDFWPTTGVFITRSRSGFHGRGVYHLLKYLGVPK